MKIKYTQNVRKRGVDTVVSLALEEDEAGTCLSDDDDDDDFQCMESSPVIFKRKLAVENHVKKRVLPKSLRLRKNEGSGDAAAERVDVPGNDLKIYCDALGEVVLGSAVTSTSLVSLCGERRVRETEKIERRVLKDLNVRSGCNGNKVSSGKLQKLSKLKTPNLANSELDKSRPDQGTDSSVASDHSVGREQSEGVFGIEPKRKNGTGWNLLYNGSKRVKTISEVSEDASSLRYERTDGRIGLDSEGNEGVEIDRGDEVDEYVVNCTQCEEANELEPGQFAELGRVSADNGKKTVEDRPNRKHNIYDILLGNIRADRAPANVSNPLIVKELECDDVEELETPDTLMLALVDEAELDYEGLGFDEEHNDSRDSFWCPMCGISLVEISVSERYQHDRDCLENDGMTGGSSSPMICLGQEAGSTEAIEIETVIIETLECPVCGMCIEELSTAEREVHTNACLEKDHNCPGGTNYGDCVRCSLPSGGSQLLTRHRSVVMGTLACPVCGVCIDELSTAQREEHTNTCLDKSKEEDRVEAGEFASGEVAQALGNPDVDPVATWLTSLNLGKYVDIFVREEIDWDTLKWLTEEDLDFLGITALGPRRKLVCAIQQLQTQNTTAIPENQKISDSVVLSSAEDSLQGLKKTIADFFIRPPNIRQPVPGPDRSILASSKAQGVVSIAEESTRSRVQRRPISTVGNLRSAGTSNVPTWMCIPGTSFRVDAFKYTSGNCSNWFLTHFHTDHYQGLTRGFRHGKIFCSIITARLVQLRIGVPSDRIQALPLNQAVLIDGVRVTFIEANHCPGSVMILFEPPNGKAVLHTGDFRFCSDMSCNEVLRACRITTLILDTTYCDPQYDFPNQDSVVDFVIDAIQAEAFNSKTLFLIGTYTIGKERIFLEVGKALKKFVYVGTAKRKLLDCMDLAEEDRKWLTTKDQESHIHVVPLWSVSSFKRMGSISRHYHGRYNSIVAFSPTGWSFGKDKKRIHGRPGRRYQQGSIIRYEVPYSEHSSFAELKEFVRTIGAENIVPSVISRGGLTADAMVASLLTKEN